MNTDKNKKNIKNYIVGIVFILFIGVMFILLLVLPKSSYSSNEKRYLNSFPQFSAKTLFDGSFGTELETYISDHVAGRDFFVGMNAYYNLYSGRNGASGVYNAKDDYLINVPVEETSLQKNVEILAKFSSDNNLNARLMIVPSTGYILNEQLPSNHYNYNDDEMFEIINSNKGSLELIDLRQTLKKPASNIMSDEKVFFKTDHHWTQQAAFKAYNQYCKSTGLTATSRIDFDVETYTDFYGTTYSTSAFWFNPPDNIEVWKNKNHEKSSIKVEITEGGQTDEYYTMYFTEHLKNDDKYPIFLDGNHSLVKITNNSIKEDKKILLIKDSFSHCFAPFLADNYSEVILVDLRYYKAPVSELIKKEAVTDVLMLYGIDNLAVDTNLNFLA